MGTCKKSMNNGRKTVSKPVREVKPHPWVSKSKQLIVQRETELGYKLDFHLREKIGVNYGTPQQIKGNNCLFMSIYRSFDDTVREILRDGCDPLEPAKGFRAVNTERTKTVTVNGKKEEEGIGFTIRDWKRYMDYLKKKRVIESYQAVRVNNWSDATTYITMANSGKYKHVGARFLLCGVAPKKDTRAFENLYKKIAPRRYPKSSHYQIQCFYHAQFRMRNYPIYKCFLLMDNKIKLDSKCDRVLKQSQIIATHFADTNVDMSKKCNLKYTHATCIAYHPPDTNTSYKLWRDVNQMVPVIYDNSNHVSKECTPENLLTVNYGINEIYYISIVLPDL